MTARQTILSLLLLFCFSFTLQAQERMLFGGTTRVGVPYAKDPHLVKLKGRYLMYYSIPPTKWKGVEGWNIGIAESRDLVHWPHLPLLSGQSRPWQDVAPQSAGSEVATLVEGKNGATHTL